MGAWNNKCTDIITQTEMYLCRRYNGHWNCTVVGWVPQVSNALNKYSSLAVCVCVLFNDYNAISTILWISGRVKAIEQQTPNFSIMYAVQIQCGFEIIHIIYSENDGITYVQPKIHWKYYYNSVKIFIVNFLWNADVRYYRISSTFSKAGCFSFAT